MGASLLFMASAWDDPPASHDNSNRDATVPALVSTDHPDFAVITGVRAGDRTTFEGLYRRTYDGLWRFAYRLLGSADAAEDAVQDVFLALWRRRDVWTPQGTVEAYLFTAVRNRALKQIRHQSVVNRTTSAAPPPTSIREETAEQDEDDERRRRVVEAIVALPERQATAIRLRWLHEMTYPEIAQILGISPQAARTLVLRIEGSLRRVLQDLMR